MAVAYDAVSAADGLLTLSWTHTPVGTPKGVLVWVSQDNDATDVITGFTYGGVAMTEVTGSPISLSASKTHRIYCYFLGSGIPTGAQTVTASLSSGTVTTRGVAVTLTAAGDTEVQDTDVSINAGAQTNPSATLALGGNECWCGQGFGSGQGAVTSITPLSGWTGRDEKDFGSTTSGVYTYNTVGTADVTMGWTQTSEDAIAIGVAIKEAAVVVNLPYIHPEYPRQKRGRVVAY